MSDEPVYTDWFGQTYTREDFDRLSEVWVCRSVHKNH